MKFLVALTALLALASFGAASPIPAHVEEPAADLPCVVCEFLLKEVASNFPAGLNETTFEDDLNNLCGDLPATVVKECKAVVLLEGDKIYKALNGTTPPDQVCSEIKLCDNSTVVEAEAPVEIVAEPAADLPCVVCEFLLKEVAEKFPAGLNETTFEDDLNNLCGDLPATVVKACKAVVLLEGDKIYKALNGTTPPDQVCSEIKLCDNSTAVKAEAPVEAVAEPDADAACVLCEFLLKEVAENFPAGLNESTFEDDLNNLCEKLPSTVIQGCKAVVLLEGDKIYKALNGTTAPDQVCSEIKLCDNSTVVEAEAPVEIVAEPAADLPCVVCEFLLKEVAANFPAGLNETTFEDDLNNLCGDLPATVVKECKAVVLLSGDKIYKALHGDTAPQQVCSEIKLCDNSTAVDGGAHPHADLVLDFAEQ